MTLSRIQMFFANRAIHFSVYCNANFITRFTFFRQSALLTIYSGIVPLVIVGALSPICASESVCTPCVKCCAISFAAILTTKSHFLQHIFVVFVAATIMIFDPTRISAVLGNNVIIICLVLCQRILVNRPLKSALLLICPRIPDFRSNGICGLSANIRARSNYGSSGCSGRLDRNDITIGLCGIAVGRFCGRRSTAGLRRVRSASCGRCGVRRRHSRVRRACGHGCGVGRAIGVGHSGAVRIRSLGGTIAGKGGLISCAIADNQHQAYNQGDGQQSTAATNQQLLVIHHLFKHSFCCGAF